MFNQQRRAIPISSPRLATVGLSLGEENYGRIYPAWLRGRVLVVSRCDDTRVLRLSTVWIIVLSFLLSQSIRSRGEIVIFSVEPLIILIVEENLRAPNIYLYDFNNWTYWLRTDEFNMRNWILSLFIDVWL